MRKARIGTFFIAAVAGIACWLFSRSFLGTPLQLANWSAAPLAISIASFSFLLVRATLAEPGELQSASTASYVISGPSAGLSFLLQYSIPSASTPSWMGFAPVVLFFGSAGLYYLCHDYSDDERPSKKVVRSFSNV